MNSNKSKFIFLLNFVLIFGLFQFTTFSSNVIAVAEEKVLSIDIRDFYFNSSVPSAFTSGSTSGTDVTGNDVSTCQIPVFGRLGHVSGDLSEGFRINDSTLKLTLSFGGYYLVGVSGSVYTANARTLLINNVSFGSGIKSTTTNVLVTFDRINLSLTGEITFQASGSLGFKEIIFYYQVSQPTSSSITSSTSLTSSLISLMPSTSEDASTVNGYYASVENTNDANLKSELSTILRSILISNLLPTNITYGNARYDIPKFDADPNNPYNVILVYSENSVNGYWDNGETWNREHVFPQSLMGVETDNHHRHKGADYHNLKPESPSVNSSRGNKYFAESTTATSYAPPTSVRGDIARIMFYMVTMWPELTLVDVEGLAEPQIFQMAQLSLFVKWHLEDPVDTFESNRNRVIYSLQQNRNPYVDRPEYVCRIWGTTNINTQTYCAA